MKSKKGSRSEQRKYKRKTKGYLSLNKKRSCMKNQKNTIEQQNNKNKKRKKR